MSTFLTLQEVVEADAVSLTENIKSVLDSWGISGQNMIGIGSDGAAVMVKI